MVVNQAEPAKWPAFNWAEVQRAIRPRQSRNLIKRRSPNWIDCVRRSRKPRCSFGRVTNVMALARDEPSDLDCAVGLDG